ncbi:glycosyltransferase family 9 protein, partial [Salmonella enterica]|uniref:glycosyltransferase family 9 protein n=1 Tax=Salmonella enterica TaxID=28901 RepID=UPI0032996BDB
ENPEINALYGISNKGAGTKEKITNALSLIKKLRANSYDLFVNLTDQWSVALIVRFVKSIIKISQDVVNRMSEL